MAARASSRPSANDAVAESSFATLLAEFLDRYAWPAHEHLRTAIFEYIEVFYNRSRRHSPLGHLGLDEYERSFNEQQLQAQIRSPLPSTEMG